MRQFTIAECAIAGRVTFRRGLPALGSRPSVERQLTSSCAQQRRCEQRQVDGVVRLPA
jgi:hypothetical protein